jgi:hypothetical protein
MKDGNAMKNFRQKFKDGDLRYINTPQEFNAFFQSYAQAMYVDIRDYFDSEDFVEVYPHAQDFVRAFNEQYGEMVQYLNPEYRRKWDKRLAGLYGWLRQNL